MPYFIYETILGSRGSLIGWKGRKKIFIIIIVIIIILKRVHHKMLCALVPLVGSSSKEKKRKLFRFVVFFAFVFSRECCQVNNKYNMQIKIIKREREREFGSRGEKLERDERRRKFIQITAMNISYSLSTQPNAKRMKERKVSEKNLLNIKKFTTYTVRNITFFSSAMPLKEFRDKRFKFRSTVFFLWQTPFFLVVGGEAKKARKKWKFS